MPTATVDRTVLTDRRMVAENEKLQNLREQLRDVEAEIEQLRKSRDEDRVSATAAAIAGGAPLDEAMRDSRNTALTAALAKVEPLRLAIRMSETRAREVQLAIAAEIRGEREDELAEHLQAVAVGVHSALSAIANLGEFLREMTERGAEFDKTKWMPVFPHSAINRLFLLPLPGEQVERVLGHYQQRLRQHVPDIAKELEG